MKRIVTIQDISCIGKCSLTVAVPIISAMGVETAIIPTAVLSAHTAFEGFTFRDLTDDIEKISEHWKKENLNFDAIYTGYLGTVRQVEIVSKFFDDYKTNETIIVVDPVMADNGKLYAGFTDEFPEKMRLLCAKADVIIPNLTEACLLLGIPYIGDSYDLEKIKGIVKQLSEIGADKVVLTGVSLEADQVGVVSYDKKSGMYFSYFNQKIQAGFHGTGDVFASSFTGALMNGYSFREALKLSTDFTMECIKKTVEDEKRNWYGVNFEQAIPYLVNRIGKESTDCDERRRG